MVDGGAGRRGGSGAALWLGRGRGPGQRLRGAGAVTAARESRVVATGAAAAAASGFGALAVAGAPTRLRTGRAACGCGRTGRGPTLGGLALFGGAAAPVGAAAAAACLGFACVGCLPPGALGWGFSLPARAASLIAAAAPRAENGRRGGRVQAAWPGRPAVRGDRLSRLRPRMVCLGGVRLLGLPEGTLPPVGATGCATRLCLASRLLAPLHAAGASLLGLLSGPWVCLASGPTRPARQVWQRRRAAGSGPCGAAGSARRRTRGRGRRRGGPARRGWSSR